MLTINGVLLVHLHENIVKNVAVSSLAT